MKIKFKFNVGDEVELLDYRFETSNRCTYNHFWVEKMDCLIGQIFKIKGVHCDSQTDIYYTINNPGASWGFNEHWFKSVVELLPEELFEI